MRSWRRNSYGATLTTAPRSKLRCARHRDTRGIASERRWPDHGVWRFPCRPELDAIRSPALWLVTASPATVLFDHAPAGSRGLRPETLLDRADLTEQRRCDGARYLAIRTPGATHRAMLLPGAPQGPLCCTIEPDACVGLRLAATARLLAHLGFGVPLNDDLLRPTRFQQRRLTLLLALLDRLGTDGAPSATVRTIASELVYRNLNDESAAVWKGSSQRRQTQRLIAEAKALMNGGYRTLLLGKLLKSRD